MCECCLGARCVRSWIRYGLKQGIHWHFFVSPCLYYFYVLLFIKIINIFRVRILPPQPIFSNVLSGFYPCLLLLSCFTHVLNKYFHGTGSDYLSSQYKGAFGKCCLEERCVSSWSCYDLKWGIPWKSFVWFLFILLILCIPNVLNKSYHDKGLY